MAYSEHLFSSAFLLLPLQVFARRPILAYNISLLLTFILSGCGMYLLVLHWTRQRPAALVAGVAFAFAPYRLAAIAHIQLLTLQWLPFSLLALDGLLAATGRRRWRWAGLLALFLGLQVMASWYLAIFSGLILGVYLLAWLCTPSTETGRARIKSKSLSLLYVAGVLFGNRRLLPAGGFALPEDNARLVIHPGHRRWRLRWPPIRVISWLRPARAGSSGR